MSARCQSNSLNDLCNLHKEIFMFGRRSIKVRASKPRVTLPGDHEHTDFGREKGVVGVWLFADATYSSKYTNGRLIPITSSHFRCLSCDCGNVIPNWRST